MLHHAKLPQQNSDRSRPLRVAPVVRRRNLLVLLMLLAFVAFAFTLSFSHVSREVGGASRQTQS